MLIRILLLFMALSVTAFAQVPPIDPGVSQELAKWRAARYSDVRYKLNLTLEKMSPVLKGTIEIRVTLGARTLLSASPQGGETTPIILDWRKIRGHEGKSTISNVSLNGRPLLSPRTAIADKSVRAPFEERNEHLIFTDGVMAGENVIKLDFTSPILPSGSAITRYVDKEDGSEYLYSLFVPSDASTAFPVFDQPDLKARISLDVTAPKEWRVVSNTHGKGYLEHVSAVQVEGQAFTGGTFYGTRFPETKPISSYVFAFAAGPFSNFREDFKEFLVTSDMVPDDPEERLKYYQRFDLKEGQNPSFVYVRKSQAAKFKPHAAEVFRLNREAVKYFEEYFDYKFPFPKYDLVLIPEFPFGGMEHAGATFLREASIIFPQEPTKNDHISRATLIFHEAAHQWFGDTVTMRWFDDLWLKEGFATFTAYKALEKIMPEMNAWKVFYERIKQGAYQTDSTKGTTPIYQEIKNLSAAKSAYGNIVYNKAPAFLRQAEFYLGEDKFQAAVRVFLRKHEFGNAGWEDLVGEIEAASKEDLKEWAKVWVTTRGLPTVRTPRGGEDIDGVGFWEQTGAVFFAQESVASPQTLWKQRVRSILRFKDGRAIEKETRIERKRYDPIYSYRYHSEKGNIEGFGNPILIFPNYSDYGYGIFLLGGPSLQYVLKNIQNEKDPFLRSMMWGALWDSVREGELDPREYVELVVTVLMQKPAREQGLNAQVGSNALADAQASATEDESTTALLLNRVGTAMNYYIDAPGGNASVNERGDRARDDSSARSPRSLTVASLPERVEDMLIAGMQNASTQGQRITYYRALLNIASSEKARGVLKEILKGGAPGGNASVNERGDRARDLESSAARSPRSLTVASLPVKTKDKFDIVTKLLILNDPDASKLLSDLEKTETSDDAKRYAYAARAGIGTAENKAKYWNDFVNNKEISESWIEAAFGPWNSIRHSQLTMPYLQKALQELPNHKRSRKIFFVNGWLGAFIGGQRSEEALGIVNKFLADNPNLDNDLRLKILENVDVIERAVRIRSKYVSR